MIAVTGATGRLGRLVVGELLARVDADGVIAVVRSPEKARDLLPASLQVRCADYDEPETLRQAFAGVDTLLLISSSGRADRIRQHRDLVEAAAHCRVGRVVYTSFIDPELTAPFGEVHIDTERRLAESGMKHTILRPSMYASMALSAIDRMVEAGVHTSATDGAGVAYVSRADIARAAATVLTEGGHDSAAYELTGPEAVSDADLVAIATRVSGRDIRHERVSLEVFEARLVRAGTAPALVERSVRFQRMMATGRLGWVTGDVERLTGRRAEDVAALASASAT